MEPRVTYVVCTNPRSGSWLLAEGLEATRVAGRPLEWFHETTEQNVSREAGLAVPSQAGYGRYVAHLKEATQTPNGVFGLKLHYYQFEELQPKLRTIPDCADLAAARLLEAAFPQPKYLWLTRRDKARQAVSYHRACQTDGWWQKEASSPLRRPGTTAVATFDPQQIEALETLLVTNDANWQRYFVEVGSQPFVLTYEELAADYCGVIRQVLRWLGVSNAQEIVIPPPALKKQADATTDEWVERYQQFKRERSAPLNTAPLDVMPPAPPSSTPAIPDSWKRWVAENKLAKTPDDSVIDTLVKHGFARDEAAAEVERAGASPYLQAGDWYLQRLKKTESLLGVYRELQKLRPHGKEIERRPQVSRQEFLERYYIVSRPVILQGLMEDWPAMRRWTPDYLKGLIGQEEVEIMAGRSGDPQFELNCHDHRRKIPFGQYVDMVHSGSETNDYYLVANNGFLRRPRAKQLLDDIEMFPEYLDAAKADGSVFFWYGPAGTVTPLHHDTSNIFMAQVLGRKRIKLISPNESEFLYNDIGVFSPVDCDAPDLARWPHFGKADVIEVVLAPGEVLFLPVGWWHHVRALDVSITVSLTNFAFANHYEWAMPQIRK